jgi:hypothetical protein
MRRYQRNYTAAQCEQKWRNLISAFNVSKIINIIKVNKYINSIDLLEFLRMA